MIFAEATVEIKVKVAQAVGANLFAPFIIFKRDLPNSPGTRTGDSARDKVTTKWNELGSLFGQVAQTQTTNHSDNQLSRMFHGIGGVERLTIERTQAQNEANLGSQQNRNVY